MARTVSDPGPGDPGVDGRPSRRVGRRVAVALVSTVLAVLVLLPDRIGGVDRVLPFAVFAALRLQLAAAAGA